MLSYAEKFKLAAQLIQKGYLIHCTNAEFDSFDPSFIKGGMRAKEGYGFYFTDMPYKSIDYGDLFKVIKKDDFNFLDSSDKIDISLFYDDTLEIEIAKIDIALDNARNIREYDYYTQLQNELKQKLDSYDEDLYYYVKMAISEGAKTYGNLEYLIKNPHITIPKLIKVYTDNGYDGYSTDGIYTVFNFDKLNKRCKTLNDDELCAILNESVKKSIVITESQLRFLIDEGVTYTKNDDLSIDMRINHDMTDSANLGKNSADTRVFGSKHDVLYGDGTSHGHTKHLAQLYNDKLESINFYKFIINIIENGNRNAFYDYIPNELPKSTYTSVKKWFDNNHSDARIIDAAKKALGRLEYDFATYKEKYERVNNAKDDEHVMRYITSRVPNTNVKYIALFAISDFNFSDAIKHGFLRQNSNTDSILGISADDRAKNGNTLLPVKLTYDNGAYQPNVAQNFSLDNVKDGHFKQQYGFDKPNGYSSINGFIDKSIIYANMVLKKEKYEPDFIVSVPSSSKFNDYYCQNLSNKLGCPYISDFFKRNFLNVRFDDGRDVDEMKKHGFSDKDIFEFSSLVRSVAYKEIAYIISQPIKTFLSENDELFSNISKEKNSREKADISNVYDCMISYAYQTIIEELNSGVVNDYIVKNFMNNSLILQNRKYNYKHIISQIHTLIKLKIGLKKFNRVLVQMRELVQQYISILQESGYRPRFNSKRFKITQIKKQFRPFLHNVYVVSDNNLNKDGELFKRYQNAKFLIFDEDINSGASLKCSIDALQEKLPNNSDNNILCLVNAYSNSGF